MTLYALVQNGLVLNVIDDSPEFADGLQADWQAVVELTGLSPQPEPGWRWGGATTFSPPPTYQYPPSTVQLGTFFEAFTEAGYQWYYIVGPVLFAAAPSSPVHTTQPTVAAMKSYVGANATDEQFHQALAWSLDYRTRLTDAITAAGGNPATNQRVTKLNAIINALGAAV